MSYSPASSIGKDGNAVPGFSTVIAGKDGSGNTRSLLVGEDGVLNAQDGGSDTIGDSNLTVTTAGTAVQFPDVSCKRVYITSHEDNTGTVCIGGSTVVAALAGRRGRTIYNTQEKVFYVNNLNLLYADSTQDGDKVHYYYET